MPSNQCLKLAGFVFQRTTRRRPWQHARTKKRRLSTGGTAPKIQDTRFARAPFAITQLPYEAANLPYEVQLAASRLHRLPRPQERRKEAGVMWPGFVFRTRESCPDIQPSRKYLWMTKNARRCVAADVFREIPVGRHNSGHLLSPITRPSSLPLPRILSGRARGWSWRRLAAPRIAEHCPTYCAAASAQGRPSHRHHRS